MDILETTTVDCVLFETAGVIKAALIREWPMLQQSDITILRQYLLLYIIDRITLPSFVRERILQVITFIMKKGMIEGLTEESKEILNEVEKLITSADLPRVSNTFYALYI